MEGGGGDPADGSAAASSAVDPRSVDEEVIRRHCEQYNDEMKGQAGRDLLFDFKDMHSKLLHFGTHSSADGSITGIADANYLQLGRGITALIQGTLLGAHLEGTAQESHEVTMQRRLKTISTRSMYEPLSRSTRLL